MKRNYLGTLRYFREDHRKPISSHTDSGVPSSLHPICAAAPVGGSGVITMSDVSPDSASAREESSRPADLTAGPDSAGTSGGQPDLGDLRWPSSPTSGSGAPDPGAFQPPSGPPPAGGFGAPDPGAFQPPFGAPPPGSYPGMYPAPTQRPRRRLRGPLIGFLAGAVAVALAVGGYAIASNLSSSGNKPIATSVHPKSAGITVTGHGIELAFPAGWQNVPTSPNQLKQFMNEFAAKFHHVPSQLQSEVDNPQALSTFAMLVFHFNALGNATENLNAIVEDGVATPSEMISELRAGQGPAQFGATNIQYSATKFGAYPGVIVTYTLSAGGITLYGAQSYLDGPGKLVITTVTSQTAATCKADLRQIVDTIRFV